MLSLFASQPQYGPGQQPKFEVYAVSTARGTCELMYGPAVVRVMVTKQGQVTWDSAACRTQPPAAPERVRLAQGVPQVVTVSWNRRASTPGCAGSVPAGATGTFDAVALADGRSSPVRQFKLSR